ncbi:MAG TPA: tRNA (guanosine(37)-N1)-methyltransferase TrmD [Thiolinea sp.]|nr:tRNA (guanosine(37)-N1)-methyltransferase TrmD [Thiolinea sp.]
MRFDVITLFPDLVWSVAGCGVVGRALERGLISLQCTSPRDFTHDVHRTVDDRPYGGGPGIVMKPDALLAAIRVVRRSNPGPLVYMSPQGRPLTQVRMRQFAQVPALILLAGRYEGIDERVIDLEVNEECSLGDYVLSGGELAAMAVIDGVTRLLPGALGHDESAVQDSFTDGLLDCPHYTRPDCVEGLGVPAVLKSGDHAVIARWRRKQSLGLTWLKRPDLLKNRILQPVEQALLAEFIQEYKVLSEVKP